MKKSLVTFTAAITVALLPSLSSAGDADTCKGCHNGSVAPSVDTLKGKFKTVDELVAGAKASKNDMMKPMQADTAKLKAAAAEILK
ncbi:hypothetical protein PL263_17025 [Methylomonas sp. EFPC3]|uniref:hypothetical protein n=1 Tax=Methylomonas sp. EFPC3 TaxID=3021710 RepID=UPI002416C6D7|nr:hypothetical protein [Methylomonas sp. EFPC3]WFP49791.1 hypothetical protein PL263_17025 [Methylomonas sp. EFPC3]